MSERPGGHPRVRPLTAVDIPAWLDLIDALADYERLPRPAAAARARLAADAGAPAPPFSVLLAERAGQVAGYAVYFLTYSTFLARPTLYLEDLFVLPAARGHGAAYALMQALAAVAQQRGCGRMEWQVLTWNAPAIAFYERLGAVPLDEWQSYRLTADQLARLAGRDGAA